MHWTLKRRLKKLSQRAEPDPRFVQALEARILSQMKPRGWQSSLLRFGAALASFVCIVGGTTGVYAYESEQVLPGHFLYPVRESIEYIEEQIATTPEKRVEVTVKHIERRMHEYVVLNRTNRPIPPEQVAKIDASIQRAVDETVLIDAKKREALPKELPPENKEKPLPVEVEPKAILVATSTPVNVPPVRKPEPKKPEPIQPPVKPQAVLEKPERSLEQKIQSLDPQNRLRFQQIQKERESIAKVLRATSTEPVNARVTTSSREDVQRQNQGDMLQGRLLELQRRIEMERRKAQAEMLQKANLASPTPSSTLKLR